jgi:tetratricopeptide (TPR) repeat protein
MAGVYNNQGEYVKALEWYEKGLAIELKTLGPDHPSTATSYSNMAVLCYNMEEYKKSLEYFETALKIRLKSLGPSHPHVTDTRENIEVLKQKL